MEPTPSPYSMKVNLDEPLPDGESVNYSSKDDLTEAPVYIKDLFSIDGVTGLYRVIDFITLQRNPRVQWEEILPEVRSVLGSNETEDELFSKAVNMGDDIAFGEINVSLQMIRNIPTQVKLQEGDQEKRFALPERIMNAAMEAATASGNYLLERKWVEQSPRYGDIDEVGSEVVDELSATYNDERLKELLELAINNEFVTKVKAEKITLEMLDQPDWKDRYAALDRMDPTKDDYPVLDKALEDAHSSVRRLAAAFLGMIEDKATLPYLYKALKDKSVNVRRTAGDCLSDFGFEESLPEMIDTLSDKSRIVRWRGAMFLYETGDKTAIPALQKALEDPEFEVRMQAKMALARIEGGKEAEGSIWAQMQEAAKE